MNEVQMRALSKAMHAKSRKVISDKRGRHKFPGKKVDLTNKYTANDDVKFQSGSSLPQDVIFKRTPGKRLSIIGERDQSLSNIMPTLPDVDTDFYIIASGRGKDKHDDDIVQSFGFGNFVDYVCGKFGNGCVVYISTWSMNLDHAYMLLELLDYGLIRNLHVLSDPSILNRKLEIMSILKAGMDKFTGNRMLMFRNHSKILCIRNRNGDRFCTVTGSANLSGNPRAENYTVSTDPVMYQHFVDNFFDVMFLELS